MEEIKRKSELEKFIDKYIPFVDSDLISKEELKSVRKIINSNGYSLKDNKSKIIEVLTWYFFENEIWEFINSKAPENINMEYYNLLLESVKKEKELREIQKSGDDEKTKKEAKKLVYLHKTIIKKKLLVEMQDWINCDGHLYSAVSNEWDDGCICIKCGYHLNKSSYANYIYKIFDSICKGYIKPNLNKGGFLGFDSKNMDISTLKEMYNQIIAENPQIDGDKIVKIMGEMIQRNCKTRIREIK